MSPPPCLTKTAAEYLGSSKEKGNLNQGPVTVWEMKSCEIQAEPRNVCICFCWEHMKTFPPVNIDGLVGLSVRETLEKSFALDKPGDQAHNH